MTRRLGLIVQTAGTVLLVAGLGGAQPPPAALPAASAPAPATTSPGSAPAATTSPVSAPAATTSPLPAPPPPKNLQVLPKDLDRRQVIGIMRGWTRALGVRCEHCHVETPGKSVLDWDLAADDKAEKKIAREMVGLVIEANRRVTQAVSVRGEGGAKAFEVSCATCHHGVARPRSIEAIVSETMAAKGVETAIADYRALREKSRDRGSYDFTAAPLATLAERALAEKQLDAAEALVDLGLEESADDLRLQMIAGEVAAAKGDIPAAIAAFERALKLAPGEPSLLKRLEVLRQGAPPASP